MFDLIGDEHQDLFWASVAVGAVVGSVADIAAGYIGGTVDGEGDAVGHLSAPA